MSINSNIAFKILWIHFVPVALMLKQIRIFFFTALCLLIKDAPSWAQLMNDIDSSNDKYTNDPNDKYSTVKYTNDSILTHILLFGKVSLDISANTLILTATMKHIISTNRFQKSLFWVFCNFLLYFHLFNFFPYPYVLFLKLYIHIHLVHRFAFIYLLTLLFYILFLVMPRWFSNI